MLSSIIVFCFLNPHHECYDAVNKALNLSWWDLENIHIISMIHVDYILIIRRIVSSDELQEAQDALTMAKEDLNEKKRGCP